MICPAKRTCGADFNRISLSSTGFYATPKIHYDRSTFTGRPFFYYAYGVAVAEAVIDTLTGENRITRVDILHDCGKSLNPAIDLGQVEGQANDQPAGDKALYDQSHFLSACAPSIFLFGVFV